MPDPQPPINSRQTQATIFLVLTVTPGQDNADQAREVCADLDAVVRAVGARDPAAGLSAIVAFGSDVWERLCGLARPSELHTFHELHSGPRFAPSTPGDLLFHIRADSMDLCYELGAQLMTRFGASVAPQDEVHGFRYFDNRDLIGFVDGTENPAGAASVDATIVGDEDPSFSGGSYVIVQKYLTDFPKWHGQPTETQEGIIGRTKLDDMDLAPAVKPSYAHNALTTLVENGVEVKILRHNMPFGNASGGVAGTYFIGYARSPHPIEQMLENMVIGRPPGNYDRLLDFTHPVTGTNFFAPSVQFLAALATSPPPEAPMVAVTAPEATPASRHPAGTLSIGSLKGVPQHE